MAYIVRCYELDSNDNLNGKSYYLGHGKNTTTKSLAFHFRDKAEATKAATYQTSTFHCVCQVSKV